MDTGQTLIFQTVLVRYIKNLISTLTIMSKLPENYFPSLRLLERVYIEICSNQNTNIESTEFTFYPYEVSVITKILTYQMETIDAQNSSTQAQMISQMTPGLMCVISNILNIGNLQIFMFLSAIKWMKVLRLKFCIQFQFRGCNKYLLL